MKGSRFAIDLNQRPVRRPFSVMAKPVGSKCNLDCKYCYYLEKEMLYGDRTSTIMVDDILERFVREYIASQDTGEVGFVWQGGEPTLLGIDYFRKALAFQKRYADGKRITNSLQTNGTLLDDDWARFFYENRFLIGLSMDGPPDLHDQYRVDKRGRATFDQVMRGWEVLQRGKVDTNILTVVNRHNGAEPMRVYEFLRSIGAQFVQFIPVVERPATDGLLTLAGPPLPRRPEPHQLVTDWSVLPEQYGEFMVTIYDQWVRRDVGEMFVQLFDLCLNVWSGLPPTLCWFAKSCGAALVIEHTGDVYSCDHFVYPEFKLGNIADKSLSALARSQVQRSFGDAKADTLPAYCQACEVRFACNGECPKRRFMLTPDGEPGLNYLCAAYRRFFNHVDPTMRRMAELVKARQPAAKIMAEL